MTPTSQQRSRLLFGGLLFVFCWTLTSTPAFASQDDPLTAYKLRTLLKDQEGNLPGKDGVFEFRDVTMEPGRARIRYMVGGTAELDLVLVPLSSTQKAFKESASFKVFYPAHPSHSSVSKELLMEALTAIVKRIQKADPGKLALPDPESFQPPKTTIENTSTAWQGGSNATTANNTNHLRFGFLLLILALLLLPWLIKIAWLNIRETGIRVRQGIWTSIALGGLLRLVFIPHIVVTMYMGYLLTDQAATLNETFRYGVGAQVLWNALFQIAPVDHASLIGLNAVLGTFNLIFWAAILVRAGLRPIAVLLATIFMAFMPMILWSDGSDSLTVIVLFWNLGAILFAQQFLRSQNMLDLWGAVLWLGMAAHTRPEQMLFGPLLVLTILASQQGSNKLLERLKAPLSAWITAAVAYGVLVWPQLVHAMNRRARLKELDSWPHELWDILPDLPRLLESENALLKPHMTPMLLLPLALLAIIVARKGFARRFRLSIMSLGLVWMIFYYIDLSSASLPRLHIVLLIPCCIVVADLLSDLWQWKPTQAKWAGQGLVALALITLSLQTPASAKWLWQDTNEWQEDRMYREVITLLPQEQHNLIHYNYGDPEEICFKKPDGAQACGPSHTHEHHPDYLVEAPQGTTRVWGIQEFIKYGKLDKPTYFYLGMRCYSQLRPVDAPVPETYFAKACMDIQENFSLEAVLEKDLPNRGDFGLHYYSQEKSFKLGLYQVKAKN